MAVPKRKLSVSRRGKRRSHLAANFKNVVEDKKSGEFRLPHHVDMKTGNHTFIILHIHVHT